jgi:polyribonucleotide nucleotidyltransferase
MKMAPEPKKVARVIRKLFRSGAERREEEEQERDVQIRMGKTRIRRHIGQQQEMVRRLTALARQALKLSDEGRFKQVGRQLLWTKKDIERWEKYLLSLEMLEARRDQVRASVDLISSVKAMTESLGALSQPEQVGDLQREMEQGLARASNLEERMDLMMGMMDETLAAGMPADEESLSALQADLTGEVAQQERQNFDKEIEDGLSQIRQELDPEDKRH